MPIEVKIDVNKIDKSRLFQGKKGKYLNIVLIETPKNQYGNDYMVCHEKTKEERAAKAKSIILGNAKIVKRQQQPQQGGTEDDW